MVEAKCTIFPNILSKEPHYVSIDKALERIKNGKSKELVEKVRVCKTKDEANAIKMKLPSVCFSGIFDKDRKDKTLKEHSGYLILDFDDVADIEQAKKDIFIQDYVIASWVSPSGKGIKALVRIADTTKHREHFEALRDIFVDADRSGINVSRVCYESYDPNILIKESATPFKKIKITETFKQTVKVETNNQTFDKILTWLTNRGDAFVSGSRNIFIYKLASACCRFGITESECDSAIKISFLSGQSDFSIEEVERTIKSAYRSNLAHSAAFSNDVLVVKGTTQEVEIDSSMYDLDVKAKDVVFGEDAKEDALKLYRYGYESASSTYMGEVDNHFKWKRGEITLLTGYGNFGKSTCLKYLILLRIVNEGSKFAIFAPEDFPAHEFYNDLVEMYCGQDMTPRSVQRPDEEYYSAVYDYITKHIFFIYPKTASPTPMYIKERFLELIIKEKVDFCIVDPFNQLDNDYASVGGKVDQYLERTLSDFIRFARENEKYFIIVAHPVKPTKNPDGNYPCPDGYSVAGGAMWNNKMDNIIVYHRPLHGTDPDNSMCEFHSKKIRRQKIVGSLGVVTMELDRRSRRYFINGVDYLKVSIDKKLNEQNNIIEIIEQSDECPF